MPASTRIPSSVLARVLAALATAGDPTVIRSVQPARGGYMSQACRLVTQRRNGGYFLKWNSNPAHGAYVREVSALALLRATGAVTVPRVLAAEDTTEERCGFLLQEWLTPPSKVTYNRRVGSELGARIAHMHAATALDGTPIPGYGPAPLAGEEAPERWADEWVPFFRDHLLRREVERAERGGRMTEERRRGLERVMERLDEWLAPLNEERPSLLHGDLHRNNVLCNARGELVLIDPHPSFGHRELELAYMDWVGYFPPAFYASYEATWPCAPGRQERRDLYLLLHRLHRLNDDEPGHAAAIDGTLRLYTGRMG